MPSDSDNIFGKKTRMGSKKHAGPKDVFGRPVNRKKTAAEMFAESTAAQQKKTHQPKAPPIEPAKNRIDEDVRRKKESNPEVSRKPAKKEPHVPQEDPLKRLNEDQYSAATVEMGRNLIIASAGTGKTSTIMGRLSFLMSQKGVKPEEILLLTFTSKAAQEMTERIELFFGHKAAKSLQTGTFHSASLRLVKNIRKGDSLKMPREAALLFKSLFGHRTLPEVEGGKPFSASTVYEKYGMFLNTSAEQSSFSEWLAARHPEQAPFAHIFEDVCEEFEELKKRERFYDFNDLLIIAKNHYKTNKCAFREIIVDEYQDTNTLQSSLLDTMNPESLYCVGDYDQSIYAFNGAEIGIIGSFSKRYGGAQVSTLRKNYRSSRSIIGIAEKVIALNPRLYPKGIEVMMKEDPYRPALIRPETKEEQAQKIVEAIKKEEGFGEISVIYRSNSSGDAVEIALKEAEIPYLRKGDKSFFESKDILAFISAMKIMSTANDMPTFLQVFEPAGHKASFLHLLHHGYFAFGRGSIIQGILSPDKTQERQAFLTKTENTQLGISQYRLNHSLSHIKLICEKTDYRHPLMAYTTISPAGVYAMSDLYHAALKAKHASTPIELVEAIASSALIRNIYERYASSFSKDSSGAIVKPLLEENLARMMKKIDVLRSIARKKKTLTAFFKELEIKKEDTKNQGEAVSLLSVHASKGLEFNTVHLVDLNEDVFPNTKLMNNGGGGIEEERRLFYVAVTRAKKRLLFYCPKMDGSGSALPPSRFLYESGLLEPPA